jgi:hypothetical protein
VELVEAVTTCDGTDAAGAKALTVCANAAKIRKFVVFMISLI